MRISLAIATVCILALGSCKKESTQSSSSSSSSSSSGGATITASNATVFYAIFNAFHTQSISGGTLNPVFKYCTAYFSNNATQYPNMSTCVNVMSAGMNGVQFKYQGYHYVDTTYSLSFPPANWQVTGMGSIPSFTYNCTTPMPTYTAYATLPDTVHIGSPLTVSNSGAAGYSDMTVSVSDASSHTSAAILASGANSVTLSTSSLVATTNGTLVFSISKNNVQNVNGKDMNFVTTYQVNKPVVIN